MEEARIRRSLAHRPAGAALLLAVALLAGSTSWAQEIEVVAPEVFLTGIPFGVTVRGSGFSEPIDLEIRSASGRLLAREILQPHGEVEFRGLVVEQRDEIPLTLRAGADEIPLERPLLPGWITIAPPLVAIALALLFHEVVTSLFAGVWLGCLFLAGYNPLSALLLTVGRFAREALADGDHAAILIFSLLLGGMVGLLTRMGASRAIVDAVTPLATSRRRGQFATWAAGLVIFFDDYANTLIVGNTMRPLTDRLRVSREKLAYIVDSTAAPVAAIVFVSTWVGYEISLIEDGLVLALGGHGAPLPVSPFAVFIQSIPYLFYPLLALLLVLFLIVMNRDFGPMLAAERRAVSGGGLFRPDAQLAASTGEIDEVADGKARWWMAAVPVATVVVTVLAGLIHTGLEALPEGAERTISSVFGQADPFRPLLWGSLLGCIVALILAVGCRIMKLAEAIRAWADGMRSMLLALVILMLAWSLGAVTESLGTASYLSTVLSDRLPLEALPFSVFVVAALISFATGTSWATMAILFPLVLPLAVALGAGLDPADGSTYSLLLGSIAGVMAGSLFGDHCSPLSDTTVLSSMASGCDHVDHVRTQLPYALAAAGAAAVAEVLSAGLGISPWICLPVSAALLLLLVRFAGRPVEPGRSS